MTLSQLPMKSVFMDIVVADRLPKFGMFLSRSWAKKVGGSLQIDLAYATIHIFGGEHRKLCRAVWLAYIISDHDNPGNHPIYAMDDEIGYSILHISDDVLEPTKYDKRITYKHEKVMENAVWKMFFDGSCSREGYGVGIVIISPSKDVIPLSYKIEFETTDNIAEYEAMILGLRAAKDTGIEKLVVSGNSELIIHQIRNVYRTKQPKLKQYRNEVWDLMENLFLAFNITFIQRSINQQEDSLALEASSVRTPLHPKIRYEIELRHRTSIPDNFKHSWAFNDDCKLKRFLESI